MFIGSLHNVTVNTGVEGPHWEQAARSVIVIEDVASNVDEVQKYASNLNDTPGYAREYAANVSDKSEICWLDLGGG